MKRLDNQGQDSLMTFPCDFQVKAMGLNQPEFELTVAAIVQRHIGSDASMHIRSNLSRGAKYLSVTCHITAKSRAQLDAIYLDLTNQPEVLVAL